MKKAPVFISCIVLCILLTLTSVVVNGGEAERKSGLTTSSLSTTIRDIIEKTKNNQSFKDSFTGITNKLDNIFKEKSTVPNVSLTDKLKELQDKFKAPQNTSVSLKDIFNDNPLKDNPGQVNSYSTTPQETSYPGTGEYRPLESSSEGSLPEYVPDELIVKFKKEAKIGAVADTLLERGQSFQSITNSSNLDNLNKKYKLARIKKVFADSGQGKPPSGVISTAVVNSLHQNMKDRFTEKINAVKARFPQRSKRIPSDARIPYLEKIYLFTLAKGSNVLTAAQEYSQDTNVEYAQPNYLYKTQMVPDDPYYHSQGSWGQDYDDLWGLKPDKLNCEQAWDISQGAPNTAPGEFVIGNNYYRARGTSMAAPVVSGVAALVVSLHPEFTNQEVIAILKAGVDDDINIEKCPDAGRINALKCLGIESPCISKISSPKYNAFLAKEDIDITGTASGVNFAHYKLEYKEECEEVWCTFAASNFPVENGGLGKFRATELKDGRYLLRLTVMNDNDVKFTDLILVYVMNTLKDNWPFIYQDENLFNENSSPTLADIDNDGEDEIIALHANTYIDEKGALGARIFVYAFNGDKSLPPGWPVAC